MSNHKSIKQMNMSELIEMSKAPEKDTDPDWTKECEVCGATPIVPATGLCGPCTFGESETAGGNW